MTDNELKNYCSFHKEKSAVDSCYKCHKHFCSQCLRMSESFSYECVKCRRKKFFLRLSILAIILPLAGFSYIKFEERIKAVSTASEPHQPANASASSTDKVLSTAKIVEKKTEKTKHNRSRDTFEHELFFTGYDYRDSFLVERIYKRLKNNPCNRKDIAELLDHLNTVGNFSASLLFADNFFKKCGDYSYLRWKTFYAYKGLSRWGEAISEVTRLIKEQPYDKDFWVWRGMVYEKQKKYSHAISDYRQAMAIQPQLKQIPVNISNIFALLKRYCEAFQTLKKYAKLYPSVLDSQSLSLRLKDYQKKSKCSHYNDGSEEIEYVKKGNIIQVEGQINGKNVDFIVDTGASAVVINPAQAKELNVSYSNQEKINILTVNGLSQGILTYLYHVSIGSLRADFVDVIVVDNYLGSPLLGQSFLERYSVMINNKDEVISFKGK